jgi:hypothetical protein
VPGSCKHGDKLSEEFLEKVSVLLASQDVLVSLELPATVTGWYRIKRPMQLRPFTDLCEF